MAVALKPNQDQRDCVQSLASMGMPQDAIAAALKMSPPTLRKYFRKELDEGKAVANGKIAARLYDIALNGNKEGERANVQALMFWAKVQMGWNEKKKQQNGHDDFIQSLKGKGNEE